jgi:hypothetical protein
MFSSVMANRPGFAMFSTEIQKSQNNFVFGSHVFLLVGRAQWNTDSRGVTDCYLDHGCAFFFGGTNCRTDHAVDFGEGHTTVLPKRIDSKIPPNKNYRAAFGNYVWIENENSVTFAGGVITATTLGEGICSLGWRALSALPKGGPELHW